jgi:cytosine/adenosine deaminase-related metal-dependent hydrolase
MTTTLIRGKHVICRVAGTAATVIDDGAVVQRDGTIVEVGRYADLASKYQPDEVLGSPEHVVMPGLVNGHHHVGLTPLQLGSDDEPLEIWFATRMAGRDVDPYLDTLYAAFDLLASGVTTVHHLHGMRRGPWERWPAAAERVLQAYHDAGLRVTYSFNYRDQNRLVYGPDEEFVASLSAELRGEIGELLAGQAIPLERYLSDLFVGLWEQWGRNTAPRTRIQLTPHNLHWCSDGAFMALKEVARQYGVGMHVHLLETAYQKEYARRRSGKTAVRHLYDLGFLGPEVTLGHAVWLTDEDVDILAETGTMVCTQASSNLRLKSGIAPFNELLARGVTVAMGMDEAGLNDDRDMLQEMRLLWKLHRVPGIQAPALTAAQVFRMATEHGARTTHYGSEIGTLEPGKGADLVVLDWRHITHPYLDRDVPVLDAVIQRGRVSGVALVMVAGEVVARNGRPTRVDRDQVLEELAASLRVPLRPDEERRRELARLVRPYVERFYAGWLDEARGEPFYRYNART